MSQELYKKYRPTTLERVKGQDAAVSMIKSWLSQGSVPHAILFTGPSGTGKTTLARILKEELGCSDMDYQEINGSDDTGVDMIRSIRDRMGASPFQGKCRIWMMDECHMQTKNAQNCLLKSLEDTPKHVYFMLATTEPKKVLRTIQTRCTEVALKGLSLNNLTEIVTYAARKEQMKLSEEVLDKILSNCEGSARQALVFLHQIKGLESEEDQLNAITPSRMAAAAFDLYLAISSQKPNWASVAKILRELEDDPEGIRRLILACARNSLLKGGKFTTKSYLIIDTFSENYFNTGAAGLAKQCYEIVTGAGG